MGLSAEIPFIIGGSDGCLANLGSGAMSTGELALTIGTSGAVRMTSSKPKHDSQQRIFNYILTEELYVSGGPVNNGGNVMKWYVENFMRKSASGKKDFSAYVQEAARYSCRFRRIDLSSLPFWRTSARLGCQCQRCFFWNSLRIILHAIFCVPLWKELVYHYTRLGCQSKKQLVR